MNLKTSDEIEFKQFVKNLFGDKFVFAFICGSVAKKETSKESDIDMLVVLDSIELIKLKIFRKWYIDFHLRKNFKPDLVYPGEVVPIFNMKIALASVKCYNSTNQIVDKTIYDGIVWAGMLSSDCIAFVGDVAVYDKLKDEAVEICKKWKQELAPDIYLGVSDDKILKQIITYNYE
ncbi:MAG: nucleotidyltransferase domain-containing protein [Patescibacteria group bacterium]